MHLIYENCSENLLLLELTTYLYMSSSCGRHDRKMQSVRKTPRSHFWWSFVWVSWRLQLLAGRRLQPSNLHAAGWDKLKRANKEACRFTLYWHLIQHWWITVTTTNRAERWIVQATLFFYDLSWRVKDDRCYFSRRLHVNIRNKCITHRWFCQWQKNWSHSVSGRCLWTPSVCRRPALPRRKKVLDFFFIVLWEKKGFILETTDVWLLFQIISALCFSLCVCGHGARIL